MLPKDTLKKYYGYDSFRPLQEEIISAVLQKKDTLAILPTGGGKSICFQIPALMSDGICLVISPLIALIKDQVQNLQKRGIGALAIYAGMHYADVRQTLQNAAFGNYTFLYVSPERLETKLFLEYLPAIKPTLIVVDEAHCISQWGYDFRPPYQRIAALREELPDVPIIALTASATPLVQLDICKNLQFKSNYCHFKQSFSRPNLSYSVFSTNAKQHKLVEILQNVQGSGIVYCNSRRQTAIIAELLTLHNIQAAYYHAGLVADKRTAIQQDWLNGTTRIIVCTNAFGMGIDKPNVRVVIHVDMPDCIENYYQEAGRAGRDGKRAYAVLLMQANEANNLAFKIETRYPSAEKLKQIYLALMNHLQVAAGLGEGLSFDIEIANFAQNFKLNLLEATYGIQALAQEGLVSFTEMLFKFSSIEFCVNKNDLQAFQEQEPELAETIRGLLRSYEGIFDYPCTIYENQLSKFLKIPKALLVQQLQQLNNYAVLQYKAATEKPQILLLKNRMYSDDFYINQQAIEHRKKEAYTRLNAFNNFLNNKTICRAKIIGTYFGDATVPNCGICDNCINNTAATLPAQQFKITVEKIITMLANNPTTASEIQKKLQPLKQRSVWLVLNYLIENNVILQNDNQQFILANG